MKIPDWISNGSKAMKIQKILFVISSLFLIVPAGSPVWAKTKLPDVNADGMELVKSTKYTTVYADPGTDLGIYKRFWLDDASVAFKKNWKRDQNRSHPLKVKDSDMEEIKQDVATLFRQVFTEKLVEGGYELVEEAGEDVMKIRPAIVDLDVNAPDIKSATRTRSYSQSAGEMTLELELYDSITNDKIVTARDRKRDYQSGYHEWRTSVSNRATARRMMSSWAKAFMEALEEAKATVTSSD